MDNPFSVHWILMLHRCKYAFKSSAPLTACSNRKGKEEEGEGKPTKLEMLFFQGGAQLGSYRPTATLWLVSTSEKRKQP